MEIRKNGDIEQKIEAESSRWPRQWPEHGDRESAAMLRIGRRYSTGSQWTATRNSAGNLPQGCARWLASFSTMSLTPIAKIRSGNLPSERSRWFKWRKNFSHLRARVSERPSRPSERPAWTTLTFGRSRRIRDYPSLADRRPATDS
jgi:hypothetical protein